jgi:transposase
MKTPEELLELGQRDLPGLIGYCIVLQDQVITLTQQIAQNSRNSSKPPSSDGYDKPQPKSLRMKTGKKTGGQPGHAGHTLQQVNDPDHIVVHRLTLCSCGCGADISAYPVVRYDKRQVFDLPPKKIEVTEHRAEVKVCPNTGKETCATWPENVSAPVQYGPNFLAWLAYLNVQQLLPCRRIGQMCADEFGLQISDATIQTAVIVVEQSLSAFHSAVIQQLQQAAVVHADESGIRVENKLHWLHVLSTEHLTWYGVHSKRGREAMDAFDILPHYQGTLIHDCWAPYFELPCQHGLCNGHILRELTFIYEELNQPWAYALCNLLLEMNRAASDHKTHGTDFSQEELLLWHDRYKELIEEGLAANPAVPASSHRKKRGRKKQTKAQNLLARLQKHKTWILGFLYNLLIPFTNNQGEQDIRMIKVKLKISGCFRTYTGAQRFVSIRSYVSTVRKNHMQIFPAIVSAIMGKPFIPSLYSG